MAFVPFRLGDLDELDFFSPGHVVLCTFSLDLDFNESYDEWQCVKLAPVGGHCYS